MAEEAVLPDLLTLTARAQGAADALLAAAKRRLDADLVQGGRLDPARLERRQVAAHGFAWMATYVAGLRHLHRRAAAIAASGALPERDALILEIGFGEYLAQLEGGIAMSQSEIVAAADLGLDEAEIAAFRRPEVMALRRAARGEAAPARLAALIRDYGIAIANPGDETLALIRDQFHRFANDRIAPSAQAWHVDDVLIPLDLITEMATLGVFGLTVPEAAGGLGLSKRAMVAVTEELSRASLGVGSIATRSEIAAELIGANGTAAQKARFLPRIASGEILPTAVFTEPDTGSDLGHLKTRAVRDGDIYRVHGAKTWITHAARADLMTLLVRTDPNETGYRGLSMLLAEKRRGDENDPFPVPGLQGSEIKVLGYRGMKEYEIGFDGFAVPAQNLLGGVEGQGFKQLMATFESARIQTASRAVGVAQAALELGLSYALDRRQFGKPIYDFPRVFGKIARMAVETEIARALTDFAATEKDGGRRCDIEAGMAKLLAARVAWANADATVQIHGGNGYAVESPASRLLVDARILNIFEGAAEIQANIIARGLLSGRN
ncbi:MAG: acyl-CoA dehydrogenase family protein [Stellaceae bacterium]